LKIEFFYKNDFFSLDKKRKEIVKGRELEVGVREGEEEVR
jgi:hypothetical protein